jgi:hypothetical protein
MTLALAAMATTARAQMAERAQPAFHSGVPSQAQLLPPPAPLVGGSDTCASPDPIGGSGTFAFDNSAATTGAEGQVTTNCIFFNAQGLPMDVWFLWTVPTTGRVSVATCGQTTVDTKIAAYAFSGACPLPGATALGCNDDINGGNFQSKLVFDVTAGQQILLQIGTFLGAGTPGGTGTFDITYLQPQAGCAQYDNGSTENALRLNATGSRATAWMHAYGGVGQSTTVNSISAAWGTALGGGLPLGLTGNVAVWKDPNDDGNPIDAVLVAQASATIVNPDTDLFQTIPLASPASVNGVYFVGAWVVHSAGFPAPEDDDSCEVLSGQAWFLGDNTGNFNPSNLGANSLPPVPTAAIDAVGPGFVWLLRVDCQAATPGITFCPGDGSGTACPCANSSAVGAASGCLNSLGLGGKLVATGTSSLTNDTISLGGSGMPNSSALYFQGTTQQTGGNGAVFGDGLRCAGGGVIRLGTTANIAGASQYPFGANPQVSVKGLVTTPGTRTYQIWYRNAAAFCSASTFNLSNGWQITWTP